MGRSRRNRGAPKHTDFDSDTTNIHQKPTCAASNISEQDSTGEWELLKATRWRQANQTLRKRKSPFGQWYYAYTKRLRSQELKSCPQCPTDTKRYDDKAALKKKLSTASARAAERILVGYRFVGSPWGGPLCAWCARSGRCCLASRRVMDLAIHTEEAA